jgi:hypothetical protein
MCAGIPIPLNLDKLHGSILAMSCIHNSHDHADSFTVVVSVASVVCCSNLLLPGYDASWCCEQRQVLRVFFDNLARQALPPLTYL